MQVVPGTLVGGKYYLERPLARGGMGAVWVARHAKLGSPVAIKFLDAHLAAAPALVARFEREARAAANLDTPHVVHVHDYGVEDGTPYLVMELLRGEDLSARVRTKGRLPLPDTAKILVQMGRALRRAHEAGIVHRDLKPANVFLARMEEDEMVKLLDFGIAKETWSHVDEATKTGEIFGSPHYMSPEQARGQKSLDHRADVWAVGVILYRMVTGRLPFPGEVLGEVLSSVLVDPAPSMADAAPDLPRELDGFFAKALAKKKEERFSSIGELVDAFTVIAGETPAPRASLAEIPAPRAAQAELPAPQVSETVSAAPMPPPEPPRALPELAGTTAPTQVLPKADAPTEPIAQAPPVVQSPAGTTGPSIASATSSVAPHLPGPRRSRFPWFAGVAIAGLLLATIGFVLTRPPTSPAPAASDEAVSAPLPLPAAPSAEPSADRAPAAVISAEPSSAPAPSVSAESPPPSATPTSSEAEPAPIAAPPSGAPPSSPKAPSTAVATASPVAAPSPSVTPKTKPQATAPAAKAKPVDEWGLPSTGSGKGKP